MKEFIEKLIGRLEELRTCSDYGTCNHCQNRWCPMELLEADEVIKIVNQLAEEFDGEELRKSQKIYSFIKREINPYGKPFEGTVYEFGLKVMKFIKNIHTEEFATDINVVSNNGWIPVSERLPEESLNSVLGWDEYRNRCCFVQYISGRWVLGNDIDSVKIIAWMPLPAPYKEGCE